MTVLNTVTGGGGNDRIVSSLRLKLTLPEQVLIYDRHDTLIGGTGNDTFVLRDNNVILV